jgi:predicted nucleic acid-binding protein
MPTIAVLDASFVMALFVPHAKEAAAHAVMETLYTAHTTFISPTLWLYEIASTIRKLSFFERITIEQADRAFQLAEKFEITLIAPTHTLVQRAVTWSQRLKRASAYDSFYLALAEERSCELWTADKRLLNSANTSWVRLLD